MNIKKLNLNQSNLVELKIFGKLQEKLVETQDKNNTC